MPKKFEFGGLTQRQQDLLSYNGWRATGNKMMKKQPSARSAAELVKRGLVIATTVRYLGRDVVEYEVPTLVFNRWHDWLRSNGSVQPAPKAVGCK